MPSSAFLVHFRSLLRDADELNVAHAQLRTGGPGRQYGLAALNRAAIVMSVSAWESYLEELMRESVLALRPAAPPMGTWPALSASVRSLLGRFNTPSKENVERLVDQCIGLPGVHLTWTWQNCTALQSEQRLTGALRYRHQIAHGVNPRPVIHNYYSRSLPGFFRRLARCTDEAVRNHLVGVLGILAPWPP